MKPQLPNKQISSLRKTLDRLEQDPAQTQSKATLIRLLRKRVEEIEGTDHCLRADSILRQYCTDHEFGFGAL